jgi:hypothetical protein
MQLVQRTIGNNTFVYPIHRSLCRISIKTLGQNRNQLILIHVPEISLTLIECNPHNHTLKHTCRPTLVGETRFSPVSPFWKAQVLRAATPSRWRNSSSRQSVTARNTRMLIQGAVRTSISQCFLIKTSRQHA